TCFVADVLEVIGPAEAPPIARLDAAWGEPVGTLPAVALPPDRAPCAELVVHRTGLRRAGVGALLVRKMHGVHVAVGLLVLLHHVAVASVGPEGGGIARQHVDAGFPFDDPLGELPAGTARCGDAEAVSLVEPHIAHAPGGPDERTAIGCVGDRAVDDVLDPTVLECRHAARGSLDVRHQAGEIAGKEAAAEPLGHPIGEPRRRAFLVGPQDPSHALLAQVVGGVGLAQHRELAATTLTVGFELGRFVIDDVLMLDRDCRNVEPEHPPGLPRVIAGREHEVLGGDETAFGRAHAPLSGLGALDADGIPVLVALSTTTTR